MPRSEFLKKTVMYIFLIIALVFTVYPILCMFFSSVVPDAVLLKGFLIPFTTQVVLSHYDVVLSKTLFTQWYLNSLTVATLCILINIPVSVMIAYVATRFSRKYMFLRIFGPFSLFLYMIPSVVLALPLALIFGYLKAFDTLIGLAIADSTFALPLSLWLLWGHFSNIPTEIEEAAFVDGASRWQVLFRIILPLSRPAVSAVAIFTFITVWLDYMFALTLIRSEVRYPVSIGMNWLIREYSFTWGHLMAAATLIAIPSIIISVLAFKYLLYGFEMTLKGTR